MAGMSDSEYQKVVEDLRRSKAHEPDFTNERQMRLSAGEWARYLGNYADHYAFGTRDPHVKERAGQIKARANALEERIRALSVAQITESIWDTAWRLGKRYRDATAPLEDYEGALDEIERELRICEQRAR